MQIEIVLPLITKIKMSEKRNKKYFDFKKEVRLPKKYQDKTKYCWKERLQGKTKVISLFCKETNTFAVKNSKSLEKPRYCRINGQDIYSGNMSPQQRASFVEKLHSWFEEHLTGKLTKFTDTELPIKYEMIFYKNNSEQKIMDVDNHWIYEKCFQDSLVSLGILPDDDFRYVKTRSSTIIPVQTEEECKIVIKIEKA